MPKEQTTALTTSNNDGPKDMMSEDNSVMFDASRFGQLQAFSEFMATGVASIPKHLHNNASDCFAICLQADRWGVDPYVLAGKTHLISGKLGYEATLVHGILKKHITGGLDYEYVGEWSKIEGRAKWSPTDEEGLGVKVIAMLKSDDQPKEWTCYMSGCKVRNSPNWSTKPKLQCSYQAIKEWCRVHAPHVILGIYTDDELPRTAAAVSITEVPAGASRTEQLADIIGGTNDEGPVIEPEVTVETSQEPIEEPKSEVKVTKSSLMQAVVKSGIPDAVLNEYLAVQGYIKSSQSYIDAPKAVKQRIVDNPEGLATKVNEWLGEEEAG